MTQSTTANPRTAVMDDPFDSADNPQLRPREYYGQLNIDAHYVKLIKGQGKVPWDPEVDSVDGRFTSVTMILTPLADCGLSFSLQRDMIAESTEWARIVLPSIRAQGIQSAKLADGRWVRMVQEPTGRKYRPKSGGEEREATTFKILEAYADEEACRAAYLAASGKSDDGASAAQSAFADEFGEALATGGNGTAQKRPADTKARETAVAFIAALTKQHHGSMTAIKAAVASIPLITNAIDPESEDFAAIVAENIA